MGVAWLAKEYINGPPAFDDGTAPKEDALDD